VLPFTVDEAWPFVPGHEGPVHTGAFPGAESVDAALLARWETLLGLRAVVTKALEESRAAKAIAASLEARVEVRGPAAALLPLREHEKKSAAFPGNAANLFIVSEAAFVDAEGPVTVLVGRAAGMKCERCWTYSRNVGRLSAHPGVCERCASVLEAR
jgi:isoleucyl-tRNA synthetase